MKGGFPDGSVWVRFVALQRQTDTIVADWYGFDEAMRTALLLLKVYHGTATKE